MQNVKNLVKVPSIKSLDKMNKLMKDDYIDFIFRKHGDMEKLIKGKMEVVKDQIDNLSKA